MSDEPYPGVSWEQYEEDRRKARVMLGEEPPRPTDPPEWTKTPDRLAQLMDICLTEIPDTLGGSHNIVPLEPDIYWFRVGATGYAVNLAILERHLNEIIRLLDSALPFDIVRGLQRAGPDQRKIYVLGLASHIVFARRKMAGKPILPDEE